jgi:hypothetical protein
MDPPQPTSPPCSRRSMRNSSLSASRSTRLHTQVANQPIALEPTGPLAPTPTPQSAAFVPKKNKPPTYDGKSSPDSWIAHMSSYGYGQPDDLTFYIAITYLSGDAHDWFIANQMAATAAGYPMVAWTALIEALSKRLNPLNKSNWLGINSVVGDRSRTSKLTTPISSKSESTSQV